jgi:hypothetical protein
MRSMLVRISAVGGEAQHMKCGSGGNVQLDVSIGRGRESGGNLSFVSSKNWVRVEWA